MTSESYGKMITQISNGKRCIAHDYVGISLENLLTFFTEINFNENYMTSSEDTEYYRFTLDSLYIDLEYKKRAFTLNLFNNKEQLVFGHRYENKMWTKKKIGAMETKFFVASNMKPILASVLNDIRHIWENCK